MRRIHLAALLVILGTALAACYPLQSPAPLPTDTPLPPTVTPTPTIVWFPPTPTPSPVPTSTVQVTPTADTSPKYGSLLFADSFNNPNQWSTGVTGSGSIAFGKDELSLAVNRSGGYLSSLRSGTKLDNFYAEITASPTLCRGGDEYGLLLRVSPGMDFYRFSLTCDGQTRLDKYYQGKASSPHGLASSGSIPRGAPSQSRLGVLANGRDLNFYINSEFQFTIHDASLPVGGIGVFAHSNGDNAVTVNFSDLQVYQLGEK